MALTHLIMYHIYAWPKITNNLAKSRWENGQQNLDLTVFYIFFHKRDLIIQ